jgi:hypothetical protein
VRLNLTIPEQLQANGESQYESTPLAKGVSRIATPKPGPLFLTSQPETTVIAQLRRETIFPHQDEIVHHRLSDNFTVVYHLREKLLRSSSLSRF